MADTLVSSSQTCLLGLPKNNLTLKSAMPIKVVELTGLAIKYWHIFLGLGAPISFRATVANLAYHFLGTGWSGDRF